MRVGDSRGSIGYQSRREHPGPFARGTVNMGFGVELDQANALLGAGRTPEAIALLSRVIAKRPREARALHMLGVAHAQRGEHVEAERLLEQAKNASPRDATILTDLATLLVMTGRSADALPLLDKALKQQPGLRQAMFYRGVVLKNGKRTAEALETFERLAALEPDNPLYQHNRASLLVQLDRHDEATPIVERLLAREPNSVPVMLVKSLILAQRRQLTEAIALCDNVLARDPSYEEARYNRGLFKLMKGDLPSGWLDHESRWKRPGFADPSPAPTIKVWHGEPIQGRSILVYCEQGFGDTLHFCRYATELAALGADITLLVPRPLVRLLRSLSDKVRIVHSYDTASAFDYQIALLSLPLRFGTALETIPSRVPYLHAPADRLTRWRDSIGDAGLKIGIAWQGNPEAVFDKSRSVALRAFFPLSQVPGVRLISLQKNFGAEQLQTLPPEMKIETLGDNFDAGPDAFLDTAAVMQHLDLVVAPNTAIAHLAGALARPVHIALDFNSDWRWLLDRTDSPWYPTAKLFRQRTRGDWDGVFSAIADDVRSRLA
jgi:tetratricopeptide (TPR) repeat protein